MLRSCLLVATMLASVTATKCYTYDGVVRDSWFSCNPDADVAPCCSSNDYCLSNGLCLDAGDDNYYTQQGCTSQSWESPCNWYCETDGSDGGLFGNYSHLWLCPNNANPYCCGSSADCCDTAATSTAAQLKIPNFTSAFHPPGASTSSSVTAAATTTSTVTTTVTTTAFATATNSGSSSNSDDDNDKKNSVKLGVGVGIPVGIVCSAAALAAGFFWGRHAARTQQSHSVEKASPPGYELPPGNAVAYGGQPSPLMYAPQELAGNHVHMK